ncbi:MAG: lytic transglycosylase domain-containing protein [Prevotella sp.]|nr:lytic transglycosylase domain-containing protein [Prevotella sp.]
MRIISRMAVAFLLVATTSLSTLAKVNKTENEFSWNPVMDAIIQVESNGNPKAVSGVSRGAMQITPILLEDCNQILKSRNSKKRYTLNDCFDVEKSKEMFLIIQSHYNPECNVEKAIRTWNGGPKYSVRATQRYFEKVMKHLK